MREQPAYLGLCKKQLTFTLLHRKSLNCCFPLLTNYIEESIEYMKFTVGIPLWEIAFKWWRFIVVCLITSSAFDLSPRDKTIRLLKYQGWSLSSNETWRHAPTASFTWQPRSNDLAFGNTYLLQSEDISTTQGTWIFTNTFLCDTQGDMLSATRTK